MQNYEVDTNFEGFIKRYKNSFNLYTYFFYKNTTPNSNLKEELKITSVEGQIQIYPEIKKINRNKTFLIDLNPNKDYLIVFKTLYDNGFQMQMSFETLTGTSTNYLHNYLENIIKSQGNKETIIENSFYSYSLNIMDWYCFLYQNINLNQIKMQINLLEFVNMECVTHVLSKDYEIQLNFKSGEERFLAFRKKNQLLCFKYSQESKLSYQL